MRQLCAHRDALPVTLSTGELVAALCPSCDVQLPGKFLGCPHPESIALPEMGQWRCWYLCNDCGASYCPEGERLGESRWIGTAARRADGIPYALMLRDGVDEDQARVDLAKTLGVPMEEVTLEDGDVAEGICQMADAADGHLFRTLMTGDVYSSRIVEMPA